MTSSGTEIKVEDVLKVVLRGLKQIVAALEKLQRGDRV